MIAASPLPHETLDPHGCDLLLHQLSQRVDHVIFTPDSLDSCRRQTLASVLRDGKSQQHDFARQRKQTRYTCKQRVVFVAKTAVLRQVLGYSYTFEPKHLSLTDLPTLKLPNIFPCDMYFILAIISDNYPPFSWVLWDLLFFRGYFVVFCECSWFSWILVGFSCKKKIFFMVFRGPFVVCW